MKQFVMYRCNVCGNLILMLEDTGVVPVCCNEEMELLETNSTDASVEKHVPVITCTDGKVKVTVGDKPHPAEAAHHIMWIAVITCCGVYSCRIKPGSAPEAEFTLRPEEKVLSAWAFCNLHGLWVKEAAPVC